MHFDSLQVFRGLSAIAVVLYHVMCYTRDLAGNRAGMNWLVPGASGVDFFFVLSGFIICSSHLKDFGHSGRLGSYAYRRFIRIYPLYFLFTAFMLVRAGLSLGRHVTAYSPAVIAKSLLLFPQSPGVNTIVVPGWTLTQETLFYLAFALLIWSRREIRVAFISLFLLLTMINLAWPIPGPYWIHTWLTSPYNLEFAAGCCAVILARYRVGWMLPAGLTALAASWTFISLTVHGEHPGAVSTMVLLFGIPYWLIVTGAASMEKNGQLLRLPKVLVKLGDATYSIYLGHFFFAAVLTKVLFNLHLPPAYLIIVVSTAATAFGYLIYIGVERPLLKYLRSAPKTDHKSERLTNTEKSALTVV